PARLACPLELEGVERVAAVRDLPRSAGSPDRAEQRGLDPGAGPRLAAREERWPEGRAAPGAHALPRLVLLEEVERAAAGIDQDPAERRLAPPHEGAFSRGGNSGRDDDREGGENNENDECARSTRHDCLLFRRSTPHRAIRRPPARRLLS